MIRKLHHNAWRCSDSERTRRFYEDFLGLPLAAALDIQQTYTGRQASVLHSFFRLDDGSFLAFFEAPEQPFEFKQQHDFDLHIALEVDEEHMQRMVEKARAFGIETRGISNHQFIRSAYFRDPDGYVVELCVKQPGHDEMLEPALNGARRTLDAWQARKREMQALAAP